MGFKQINMPKEGISITLDKEIIKKLNSYCDKNFVNRSKLIEGLVKDFLLSKNRKEENE